MSSYANGQLEKQRPVASGCQEHAGPWASRSPSQALAMETRTPQPPRISEAVAGGWGDTQCMHGMARHLEVGGPSSQADARVSKRDGPSGCLVQGRQLTSPCLSLHTCKVGLTSRPDGSGVKDGDRPGQAADTQQLTIILFPGQPELVPGMGPRVLGQVPPPQISVPSP